MLHKQIQKISKIVIYIVVGTSLLMGLLVSAAYADTPVQVTCSDGVSITVDDSTSSFDTACRDQHHVGFTSNAGDCKDNALNRDNCGIIRYLALFINILSAIVGIVVTGVIVWGGIQYSTSGGDSGKTQAAKQKIYNGVIAMVAFIFTYAFLQYIVPGGLL